MRKVAIITAAGYKGASTQLRGVPECCPESLLPLGGTTLLGRQVKQLKALGFECHVTVGRPGCLFGQTLQWAQKAYQLGKQIDSSRSPWTEKRVGYIRSLGASIVTIDEPDFKTAQDSRCIALDKIGHGWDQLLLTHGDHVYTDRLIEAIVNFPFPYQARQSRKDQRHNAVFVLSPATAKLYYKFAKTHRTMGKRAWFGGILHEFGDVSGGGGRSTGKMFCDLVPLRYIHEHFHQHDHNEWASDVDCPGAYLNVLQWYQIYGKIS